MSKPVKDMMTRQLTQRLEGVDTVAVVGFTGVDALTTHQIRGRLREKEIHLTVVKNSLARKAFREVGLDAAADLMVGPCALAYGGEGLINVVRELLDIRKTQAPTLEVKSAILEGDVFGSDQIDALSKYPTREEAIAQVLGSVLSPASQLSSGLIAPGGAIAGILKTIEEGEGE